MTDAQDAANADERVARALDDENALQTVPATRKGAIAWRAYLAGHDWTCHERRRETAGA
jgi:hypothetical protein